MSASIPSVLFPRARARLTLIALGFAVCGGVGCGLAESSSAEEPGAGTIPPPVDRGSPDTNSSGGTSPDAAIGATEALRPETLLVHASPDLGAMRLCVDDGDGEPLPTDNIMPRTNQVGVDVGGAASLGALHNQVKAGQQAYLVRVPWTERRDAAGTPQRHQSCRSYLEAPAVKGEDFWNVEIPALTPSSLLVISGCRYGATCTTEPKLTAIDLSSIRVPKAGNIAAAFLSLSADLAGKNVVAQVSRGGLKTSILPTDSVTVGDLNPRVEFPWTRLGADETSSTTVTASGAGPNLEADFATMAGNVDLTSTPESFYDASRFVFIAVGEIAPKKPDHPQRKLHFLALPLDNAVRLPPSPRGDGGTGDAGTKTE